MTAVYKAMQNQILYSTSLFWQSACKAVKKNSVPDVFVKLCYDLKDMGLISYSFQFTLMLLQCLMYVLIQITVG